MSELNSPNRREFLKLSGLAGAASLLPASKAISAEESALPPVAKNVIFLVVDGLGNGTTGLAHHWKLRNEKSSLHWMELFERPDMVRAYQDTASANSPVTDSAAAASAWGGGRRVNNGSINVAPDGTHSVPILTHAKAAGKMTGLVTTCQITHATPAGFATNVKRRNMAEAIARQYYEREIDVLMGGGRNHFLQKDDAGEVTDYVSLFKEKGYTVAKNLEQLKAARGPGRLLGLFAESHIPYAIDRENDPSMKHIPNLPQMFEASLERLGGSKDGFFLQVEGGRVDHAGHANDPGGILREFLEFDRCIPIAIDYIKSHPDTLLIVTTDHGTGGCQLNGVGGSYLDSGPALDRINRQRFSFERMQERFRRTGKFDAAIVKDILGIESTSEQGAIVQKALDGEAKYLSAAIMDAYGKQLLELTSVGWTSHNHTGENVEFFAMGPGATQFPPYFKNYELNGFLRSAAGLEV